MLGGKPMLSDERWLIIVAIVFLFVIVFSSIIMIVKIRRNRREPSQKLREQIFVLRIIMIVFGGALLTFCLAAVGLVDSVVFILLALMEGPALCFILFFGSLSRLRKAKSGMISDPQVNIKEYIHQQIIKMVIGGVLGTAVLGFDTYLIVLYYLITAGAISAM